MAGEDDEEQDDVNPYAAPSAEASRLRAKSDLVHSHLKYLYLGSLLAPILLTLATLMLPGMIALIGILNLVVMVVATYAFLAWTSRTWALLPEKRRVGVSPSAAAWSFFIPFYNFWWSFAVNFRIARALEEILTKYKTRTRAPTTLAWVAPLVPVASVGLMVVAFVSRGHAEAPATFGGAPPPPPSGGMLTMLLPLVALAPFVTYAWMSRVDTCNEEILFQRAEKRARKERRARDD